LAFAGAAHLTIVNRTAERGQDLARHVATRTHVPTSFVAWEGEYAVPDDTGVLVNATAIGLFPDVAARVPLRVDTLRPGVLVCDVIPNPPRTRLIADAASRGCATLDGLGMLVNQGVIGIQRWTGRDPDPAVMRAALEAVFATE
jgi:shikimate dehydrogenase